MSALPEPALAWLASRYAVASRNELLQRGLHPSSLSRHVRRGALIRVHPGVFRVAGAPFSEAGRALAACLALSDSAVSHTTAARLWGARRTPDLGTHLTVRYPHDPRLAEVRVHRSLVLDDEDKVKRDDGIVVTSPARTAFDLASVLEPDALGSVIEQFIGDRRCSVAALGRVAQRLARPGRPGTAVFLDVLGRRPDGVMAVDSDLEWRLERALAAVGVGDLVRQLAIEVPGHGVIHPDFARPELRLIIEVDHGVWHAGRRAVKDRARDRKLMAMGWTVIRVTDEDIRERLDSVVSDIVRVIARLQSA